MSESLAYPLCLVAIWAMLRAVRATLRLAVLTHDRTDGRTREALRAIWTHRGLGT
jgi:hypothetical protein